MGPRHGDRGEPLLARLVEARGKRLQWGHGTVTVENPLSAAYKAAVKVTSMGPRHGDRGEPLVAGDERRRLDLLQWGHGTVTVENGPVQDLGGPLGGRLQWGHGTVTVENLPPRGASPSWPLLQWGHGTVTVENSPR